MKFTTRQQQSITIVAIEGKLDAPSADTLLAALETLVAQHPPLFLIDMVKVEFLSSASMRAFLAFEGTVRQKGGKLLFFGIVPAIQEMIEMAGLLPYFPMEESIDSAVMKILK